MRFTRGLTVLLTGGLLALPVTVGVGAASAAGPSARRADTTLTSDVTVAVGRAIHARRFQLVGQVVAHDTTDFAVPEATVTLQRRLSGSTARVTLGTAVTGADGLYHFRTTAVRNARYYAVYAGDDFAGPDGTITVSPSTGSRAVKVERNLHDRGVKSHGRLYLKGNVDPGWNRHRVTLQRRGCSSCAWHNVAAKKTTRTGAFTFRMRTRASGSWFYRARVKAAGHFTTSSSYRIYETFQL